MEYFSKILNSGLCATCVYDDDDLDRDTLCDSRNFCHDQMMRWVALLDNATYMPVEHIQKEREFGIKWRSAFNEEMIALLKGEFADQMD